MSEQQSTEIDAIDAVLLHHRDGGVTAVHMGWGTDEHITGASAYCYCGGYAWDEEPAWRGTFNAPGDQAERELRRHIAEAIIVATRVTSPESTAP